MNLARHFLLLNVIALAVGWLPDGFFAGDLVSDDAGMVSAVFLCPENAPL